MKKITSLNKIILIAGIALVSTAKSGSRITYDFGKPFVTDSLNTIMIPISVASEGYSSSKLSYGNVYSDLFVYNYKNGTKRKLFNRFTRIIRIYGQNYQKNIRYSSLNEIEERADPKWVFIFTRENDTNDDEEVNNTDPVVIYASKKDGSGLRKITNEKVSAIDIESFEPQGFYLFKIQFDVNKDNEFDNDDNEFAYLRVDSESLSVLDTLEAF